ncbi:MAG: hypothetical protein LUD39_04410 [Opitutae bacterium]|nr:hypothetical protein [Opitutae bacterium]
MISNRNVELENVDIDRAPQRKMIVGESSRFVLLFIPFGTPTLKEAVEDALNKGDGDLIVDAGVYQTSWTAILFGKVGIEIRGTVVKTRGGAE